MGCTPSPGETQDKFVSRCIASEKDNGTADDQAAAVCYSKWRGRGKKESVSEQLPQPRMTVGPAVIEPGPAREKQYEFIARCVREVQTANNTIADDQATAMCFAAWNSRYESTHPADALFNEASDVDWSKVDKSRLPAECFLWVGNPDDKNTWKLPVYMGAGRIVEQMYEKRGELNGNALREATMLIRTHHVPASVKARLKSLLKQYDIDQEERYAYYHEPRLQESSDSSHLVEKIEFTGAEFVEEDGQRIVKNVVLLGPESSHGYGYKQEAMAKAVSDKLYEGVRIFINHREKGESRDLMQLAGVFRNTRHEGGKVRGNAHLLDDEYGRKFWNIAKSTPEAAGCSHVADGRLVKGSDGKRYVEEITKVHSVDLVVQGATTQNVFEGDEPDNRKDTHMEMKDMKLEDLRTGKPEIARALVQEGAASRDEEVQALIQEKQALAKQVQTLTTTNEGLAKEKATLTEEKKQLQAKIDEMNVVDVTRQKEAVVTKALNTLPEQARTDLFREQCMSVSTGKEGFDLKVFEAKVGDLIKDRQALCEQAGVRSMGGEQNRTTTVSESDANKTLKL
jgi:hypothetical protein